MTDTVNRQIGVRIREAREYLGYTREELAEKTDISAGFLTYIEYGKKGMSVPTLMKMCAALKVTSDYILFGKTENASAPRAAQLLANTDRKYIPYAEELIKVFLRSVNER